MTRATTGDATKTARSSSIAIVLMARHAHRRRVSSFAFVDGQQQRALEQRAARDRAEPRRGRPLQPGLRAGAGVARQRRTAAAPMPTTVHVGDRPEPVPGPHTLAAANSSTPAAANFTNVDASANVELDDADPRQRRPAGRRVRLRDSVDCAADRDNAARHRVHLPGALQVGRQRRPQAVGPGAGGRPRPGRATSSRCSSASSSPRRSARNARDRGQLRDDEQRQQDDHRRDRLAGRRALHADGRRLHGLRREQGSGPARRRSSATRRRRPAMTADADGALQGRRDEREPADVPHVVPGEPRRHGRRSSTCPPRRVHRRQQRDVQLRDRAGDRDHAARHAFAEGHVLRARLHGQRAELVAVRVLTLAANSEIIGGLAIDGAGRLVAGQASDHRADGRRTTRTRSTRSRRFGTTGLVQNTWRELPPGLTRASRRRCRATPAATVRPACRRRRTPLGTTARSAGARPRGCRARCE